MAIVGLSASNYLDHNVNPGLADKLRSLGYDALVPREIGPEKATDEEHLLRAAREGRVLITHDFDDFPRIAEAWFDAGGTHAGIMVAHQPPALPFGEFVERVLALLNELDAEAFKELVLWAKPATR